MDNAPPLDHNVSNPARAPAAPSMPEAAEKVKASEGDHASGSSQTRTAGHELNEKGGDDPYGGELDTQRRKDFPMLPLFSSSQHKIFTLIWD